MPGTHGALADAGVTRWGEVRGFSSDDLGNRKGNWRGKSTAASCRLRGRSQEPQGKFVREMAGLGGCRGPSPCWEQAGGPGGIVLSWAGRAGCWGTAVWHFTPGMLISRVVPCRVPRFPCLGTRQGRLLSPALQGSVVRNQIFSGKTEGIG